MATLARFKSLIENNVGVSNISYCQRGQKYTQQEETIQRIKR